MCDLCDALDESSKVLGKALFERLKAEELLNPLDTKSALVGISSELLLRTYDVITDLVGEAPATDDVTSDTNHSVDGTDTLH